uniref:Uncharacterized protein n=1 Tax=Romanomermis culicivorax TaxID=13658 RepID=A0A915ILL9_ROMCU
MKVKRKTTYFLPLNTGFINTGKTTGKTQLIDNNLVTVKLIQYGPSGRILNRTDSKVDHLSIHEKFDADPFGDRETNNSDLAVIKSQKMISAMKPLILSNVELSDVSKCQVLENLWKCCLDDYCVTMDRWQGKSANGSANS